MEVLRIILFLGVGIFGIIFGTRSGGNLYLYAGIMLVLIGLFNIYASWKQGR